MHWLQHNPIARLLSIFYRAPCNNKAIATDCGSIGTQGEGVSLQLIGLWNNTNILLSPHQQKSMSSLALAFQSIVSHHMSHFAYVSGLPPASANSLSFIAFYPTCTLAFSSASSLFARPGPLCSSHPLCPALDWCWVADMFLLIGRPHLTPSCVGHELHEQLPAINHPSWNSSGTSSVSREIKT